MFIAILFVIVNKQKQLYINMEMTKHIVGHLCNEYCNIQQVIFKCLRKEIGPSYIKKSKVQNNLYNVPLCVKDFFVECECECVC